MIFFAGTETQTTDAAGNVAFDDLVIAIVSMEYEITFDAEALGAEDQL